ncbi:transport system membrane protein [Camelimonas fluminis]|nr:transport system membrane protein [Camelimonas fluminis]
MQAAINAARADLPSSLRANPTYRKVNPADAPVLILTLTSDVKTRGEMYDAASTVLAQKLSQVEGVGEVIVGGSSLPAVRVELNPLALNKYGVGLEDVRAAIASANAHSPKGAIDVGERRYQIYANDQADRAEQYKSLTIAWRNGGPVRLSDVGEVIDATENLRNAGLANGKPAVAVVLFRQPNANIIGVVDRVKALLPELRASISPTIELQPAIDRSTTIRASLQDVEYTLIIAILLVIAVVFAFLRGWRMTLAPVVAVSVSLIATFAAMYMMGYSLNNLSLMALTVATGFVVDDCIVVLENITRHIEDGMEPRQAALRGAGEVGFTVLSMSVSLVAVFIPILLMGGIVGRLFREFAMTTSLAILISLLVSLTTTPMMCAVLLRKSPDTSHGRLYRASERVFGWMLAGYRRSLAVALDHPGAVMLVFAAVLGLNGYLYDVIPKGFFPQQDTGRLVGVIQADQSISFQLMQRKLAQFVAIIKADPAVDTVVGFTGSGQTNAGNVFVSLKPLSGRSVSADEVIARLRRKFFGVPGASLFLQAVQDIRVGGRAGNAQYQYTLQGSTLEDLAEWGPRITAALRALPTLADVNSDQQNMGLETTVTIDRDAAARLGVSVSQINNTLYDAFGQRQVSTIYAARNQYHVVMEVAPRFWQNPETLKQIFISTGGGFVRGSQATNAVAGTVTVKASPGARSTAVNTPSTDAARNLATNSIGATGKVAASTGAAVSTAAETMIPLATLARFGQGATPLSVNHQGLLVANTISFNLPPGVALSTAVASIEAAMSRIGAPATIRGSYQGTARAFQDSLRNQPWLILAALVTIYLVLGVLYESYLHPLTILSTLPAAGVGALLALMLFQVEFSIMALIGVILLIGIVKKNAIMMIDFALDAQRTRDLPAIDAIREACLLRFRPIMMTTMAALLGALPLVIGSGEGSELRKPLGIAIVGGLVLSQILTLYTTPVIYLYVERLRLRFLRMRRPGSSSAPQEHASH